MMLRKKEKVENPNLKIQFICKYSALQKQLIIKIVKKKGHHMFKKLKLKKKINFYKEQIELLEKKRARSQAALVEAILTHTSPNDEDVDYFNNYTKQINEIRERLHEIQDEYNKL
jgi:hypothetical protein